MYNEVARSCSRRHGVQVARSLVGAYITSLDMAGASVTLLKVDDELLSPLGRSGQDIGTEMGNLTVTDAVSATGWWPGSVAS